MPQIPTMRVKLKDGGTEMVINADDFDSDKHDVVDEKAKALAAKEAAARAQQHAQIPQAGMRKVEPEKKPDA